MTRSRQLGTLGGILFTLAVLILILYSASSDPTPVFPVDDAPTIMHVLPAHANDPSIQQDNELYYLYILDRDGNRVHEFECRDFYAGTAGGINCRDQNNRIVISVGVSVPTLLVRERLPLNGESR